MNARPSFHARLAASAALAVCALALAHGHVTVDTASGTPGEQAVAVAGYLAGESAYSIASDGRLMNGAAPWRMRLLTPVGAPAAYAGWYTATDCTLTSDFFYSTDRLNGGDFRYELSGVTDLDGRPVAGTFAWVVVQTNGTFTNVARSDASTRAARSFTVGIGNHQHGQYVLGSTPGVYRLQLTIWDANGVYRDAAPVSIELQVGAPPAGDLNGDFRVDGADLGILLGQWGGPGSGDLNGDGRVDGADLGILLGAWR